MFTPLLEMGAWVRSHLPKTSSFRLRRPHYNFITLHCECNWRAPSRLWSRCRADPATQTYTSFS